MNITFDKNVFNYTYYPYLCDYSHRFEVYYGGAGSGKSHFVAQKIIFKCLRQKRKVLVIRKVARTLQDSVYQLILDILCEWGLYCVFSVNRSTLTIRFATGSVILFKGLDDEEKIKSITGITDIWIEESTEITENEFTQLDLRMRSRAGDMQIYLSFNPISKQNWVYKSFFKTNALGALIVKTTYKDNRFLPQEYINRLKNLCDTNYNYYKIYVQGEFCTLDKLIFTNWEIREFDIEEIKRDTNMKQIVGMDFGYVNDPSTIIQSMIDLDGRVIWIYDEFYKAGCTNDTLAIVLKQKGLSKARIKADCAEDKSIDEIKQKGIRRITPCSKGQGSVNAGIDKLLQFRIIVHPSCENTVVELENYSWDKDKKTGEYINKPRDEFNHCLDALRYSLQCIDGNKIRTFNKSLLRI